MFCKPRYYVLEGKKAVQVFDVADFSRRFGVNRKVAGTTIEPDVRVSTVFLGVDHSWTQRGAPHIFETMIFGGHYDQWQERCSTWEGAEAMHAKAVRMVEAKNQSRASK